MLPPADRELAKKLFTLCFYYFPFEFLLHSFQSPEQMVGGNVNAVRPSPDMLVPELPNGRTDSQAASRDLDIAEGHPEFLPAMIEHGLPKAVNRLHLFFVEGSPQAQEFQGQEIRVRTWGVPGIFEGYVTEDDLAQPHIEHVGLTGREAGGCSARHKNGIFVPLLLISIGILIGNLSFGVWTDHHRC
jgi:hypothetical protein